MKSEFVLAFNQICSDRGLPREVVREALETALVSAYRRSLGIHPAQEVRAEIDLMTGKTRFFVEKLVVEKVTNPKAEMSLEEARAIKPDAALGDKITVEDNPKDLGRIAAQNAKQIILQRIREAEREARYAHYVQQEGEIVHGTVQSIKPHAVTLHLEGTEAILPRSQQVPGERYTMHQRIRAYVLEVRKTGRGPQITLSRSHKNMLRRLLELEVPEIFNGTVEIKAIAREAGSRSKVAVYAKQPGIDPVGACVGMRGVRIQSIVNELGGEKIDVIEWSPDTAVFISKALSPARVLCVRLDDDPVEGRTANVVVPDDQLSLAIGKAGQNARLSAKLTGWRIDIQGVTEAATWALQQVNEDPEVLPALGYVAEMLPTVAAALRRHEEEKLPYNSEELLAMRQVIEGVWNYYSSIKNAERERLIAEENARRAAVEAARKERQAAIEAAIARIPARAYEISLEEMGLSARVQAHLEQAEIATAGDIMRYLAEGDEGLLKFNGIGPKSLAEIKECIERLGLESEEPQEPQAEEAVAEAETPVVEEAEAAPVEEVAEEEEEPVTAEIPVEVEEEVVEEPVVEPEPEVEEEEAIEEELLVEEIEEEEEEEIPVLTEEKKRDRRPRRQLIYDEELGEVIIRRRRRRGEDLDELEEWEEFF